MSQTVPAFTAGELVDVRIRGARVTEPQPATHGEALYLTVGAHHFALPTTSAGVTIERVAPAEWPPQKADRWQGQTQEWCAIGRPMDDMIELVSIQNGVCEFVEDALKHDGPLTLKYRDGWAPATETTPATAPELESVDAREEQLAGLRAFADLLESRPDLERPHFSFEFIWGVSLEQIDAWAEALNGQVETSQAADGTHYYVRGRLRGFGVRPYHIAADTRMTLDEALTDAFPEDLVDDGDPGPVDGCPCEDCDDLVIARALAAGDLPHRVPDGDAASVPEQTFDGVVAAP